MLSPPSLVSTGSFYYAELRTPTAAKPLRCSQQPCFSLTVPPAAPLLALLLVLPLQQRPVSLSLSLCVSLSLSLCVCVSLSLYLASVLVQPFPPI